MCNNCLKTCTLIVKRFKIKLIPFQFLYLGHQCNRLPPLINEHSAIGAAGLKKLYLH